MLVIGTDSIYIYMVYSTSDMKMIAVIFVWFPLHLGSSQQKFPEGASCDQQTKLGSDEKANGVRKSPVTEKWTNSVYHYYKSSVQG